MAIVGDPHWKDLALMFAGKGLRSMEIEYFPTADADKARAWLASGRVGGSSRQGAER
jgi:hypothetical protein